MAHAGAVGRLARVLVGRGGSGAVHARKVLDSGSAGRAPTFAGRGRGLEQGVAMGSFRGTQATSWTCWFMPLVQVGTRWHGGGHAMPLLLRLGF